MNTVLEQMDKILQNETVDRHSFYQLKYFVIGMEPTIQAKLQCCLRELKVRRTTLESIHLEVDDLRDKNALLEIELTAVEKDKGEPVLFGMDAAPSENFFKEKEIEIRQLKRKFRANGRQMSELAKKFRSVSEECQFFVEAFDQLRQEEELRPWDDLEVQKEYWDEKLGRDFRTKLILGQPLDAELVKVILCLHDDSVTRNQTMQLIGHQEKVHTLPQASAEFAEANS